MLTRGAIGNLINRYKAVLKKCNLINTFGSLAVASMLVMGGATAATADPIQAESGQELSGTYADNVNADSTMAGAFTVSYDISGVTIADGTTFTNNKTTASAGGAAKLLNGITAGDNVTFSGNKADGNAWGGGALYIKLADKSEESSNPTVTFGKNATFSGNTVAVPSEPDKNALGGAIALEYGNLVFGEGAKFESNEAKDGGAIAMWQDANDRKLESTINLTEATFFQNEATGHGGAISTDSNSGSITMTDTDFSGNSAGFGGAIWNGDEMTITGGTLSNNTAKTAAGAIYNATKANLTITDVEFKKNSSNKAGAINNYGGTVAITGSSFQNNTANTGMGGAIANTSTTSGDVTGKITIADTDFIGNTAGNGGALWNGSRGEISITGGSFVGNNATGGAGQGGAIVNAATLSVEGTLFENNTSDNLGGAIANLKNEANRGSALSLENVTFQNNGSGENGGGALYNGTGATATFSGTNVFSNNTAGSKDNDVHNAGSMTVAGGVTLLNSGYTQEGSDSELKVNTGAALGIVMSDLGGVTPTENQALLALGEQLNLDGGSLQVGDVTGSNGAPVAFGSDSILVVDGNIAAEGKTAITGNNSVFVDGKSKLYISNAKDNATYTIFDNQSFDDNKFWTDKNIQAGRLFDVTFEDGELVAKAQDAATVMPGITAAGSLNALSAMGLDDKSDSMGVRFLSRAMDSMYYMPDDATASAMVNEVSRAAVTAGVQNTALRLADAGVNQLTHHLSLSFFGKENNIHKDGVDIWATPMYGNTYTHGMAAADTSVRGNYGGMTLGADTLVGELLGGKVRVGAAINGGGGKSDSKGTATSAENSYNFGGVNLYAGWNLDSLNVMASLGYAMADHEVKLNLPSSMGMGQGKADVDTNAFIADLRAEYQIHTDVVDLLPHAGVRYTALNTESHDLKVNGSVLNHVASDTQHIVQFPIGVTVSKDIDVSGWNVKPLADVSVIPAAGEKKNTTKVSYSGINAVDGVNTRIMDSTSWAGTVGIQAEKGNFALGLNYGIQASSHETDQNVNVGFSWKF